MERNRGRESWEIVFAGARDLFPTMLILASLPGKNSRLSGAQTIFPAVAPLRWHGARKNLQCAPREDASPFVDVAAGQN
jgi:hypothetical protein